MILYMAQQTGVTASCIGIVRLNLYFMKQCINHRIYPHKEKMVLKLTATVENPEQITSIFLFNANVDVYRKYLQTDNHLIVSIHVGSNRI